MAQERLQKYLANCGVASRRKCEELITLGEISVNGKIITQLGTKINPEQDKIIYKNELIKNKNVEDQNLK